MGSVGLKFDVETYILGVVGSVERGVSSNAVVVVAVVVVAVVAVASVVNSAVEVATEVVMEDVVVRGLDTVVVGVAPEVVVELLLHVRSEQVVDGTEANLMNNKYLSIPDLFHRTTEFPEGSDSPGASSHCSGVCSFSLMELSTFVLLLLLAMVLM